MARVDVGQTLPVWIGWDPREWHAGVVSDLSIRAHSVRAQIRRLALLELRARSLYTRPTSLVDGRLWDDISAAPMSTEHAIARFFVPYLMGYQGWALFVDGDILCRANVADLFALADDQYAVMCVQHAPIVYGGTKKTGDAQMLYPRKNWSSVVLFNCAHAANRALDLTYLNHALGRDLHAFMWLDDAEIGALPDRWNYLVDLHAPMPDAAIVHYTLGTPDLPGRAEQPFADEWRARARQAGYTAPWTSDVEARMTT